MGEQKTLRIRAAAATGEPKPELPATIGRYQIEGQIGSGAMGRVYRALDPLLARSVALKTVSEGRGGPLAPSLVERFRREARVVAGLNHPNIVTVYDFGQDDGTFFLTMELLEGTDLAGLLGGGRLGSLVEKLTLIEQIAAGVAFAHGSDLIHRDLKPANVFVQADGTVKILDFGLARSTERDLTTAGSVVGTPRYMAPEQVRGEALDARSDVFALGALFYEILGGRPCFPAESVHAVLFQILNRQPDPLQDLDPEVPASLAALLERALAKDPARRFIDAGELRRALRWARRELLGKCSRSTALAAVGGTAPREATVAVLACRIRNFAELRRQAQPYDLVHVLDRFFLQVGEPAIGAGGHLGVPGEAKAVAYFGVDGGSAREKCLAAVRAGLRAAARTEELLSYCREHFELELELGFGVHFGLGVVAQIGHPSQRQLCLLGGTTGVATALGKVDLFGAGPLLVTEDVLNTIEDDVAVGESFAVERDGRVTSCHVLLDFAEPPIEVGPVTAADQSIAMPSSCNNARLVASPPA